MTRTIIGMQRQGKSELTKHFIRRRSRPVIIMNPLDEKYPGLRFSINELERADLALLEHIMTKGTSLTECLNFISNRQKDFRTVCEIVKRHEEITLVADEIDMFDSPVKTEPAFFDLINYGDGHYKTDIITTSRRPANISRDLRSQTQEWFIFRVMDGNDLDFFKSLNRHLPEAIRSLEKYHYVYFDQEGNLEIREPIAI